MFNILLDISYKGTNYYGWQIQPDKPTVQGTILNAVSKITGISNIKLIGAGRTDAGVHALHQFANFKIDKQLKFNLSELMFKLNSILPRDIKIQSIKYVDDSFSARFSAKSRTYKYFIYNYPVPSPFYNDFHYFYPHKIDFKLLKKSMNYFRGKHNFKSFSNSNNDTTNFVCNILKFKVIKKERFVEFIIEADHFLYGMVRNIIGTILKINKLQQNHKIVKEILNKQDRTYAGEKAPASGLILYNVKY